MIRAGRSSQVIEHSIPGGIPVRLAARTWVTVLLAALGVWRAMGRRR